MSKPFTFAWLRPPRPERRPAARRIELEAAPERSAAPAHSAELRSRLTQLARDLNGVLREEDAAGTTAWLDAHWPWELAASFEPGGYRWIIMGKQGAAVVLVLLCETTELRSGSLDVVVVHERGILPNWPTPPKLPRSHVTFSTRALPHGVHFWSHLDATELDAAQVTRLVALAARALEAAEPGELECEIGTARICARCSAVSQRRICALCDASLSFRVAWGAVQRPPWQQKVTQALLVTYPLLAYGLFKASPLLSPQPSQASVVAIMLVGLVLLCGLSLYLERARPNSWG